MHEKYNPLRIDKYYSSTQKLIKGSTLTKWNARRNYA